MKRTLLRVMFSLFVCCQGYSQHAQAAATNPVDPAIITQLTGTWTNQLRSTLTITKIDPTTGQISGNYTTPSAGSTQYPLIGWVNTQPPSTNHPDNAVVISFSVRWGDIGSVAAWNGIYTTNNKQSTITGQWLLSRPNSDFSWDHVLVGQDQFHRVQ
ncbi:MAG TPA: avidin/streptavidin family protein [Verrucomicrobiae bacterium]|nr:avidin/streptavidin family protein [Verrucomicrobiae bacterium]